MKIAREVLLQIVASRIGLLWAVIVVQWGIVLLFRRTIRRLRETLENYQAMIRALTGNRLDDYIASSNSSLTTTKTKQKEASV